MSEKGKSDNVDPRLEPKDVERTDLAPRGSMGTIKSSAPTVDIPDEQKEAIAHRFKHLQAQKERDELHADVKRGVRGEEHKRPFLSKRDFDKKTGPDFDI